MKTNDQADTHHIDVGFADGGVVAHVRIALPLSANAQLPIDVVLGTDTIRQVGVRFFDVDRPGQDRASRYLRLAAIQTCFIVDGKLVAQRECAEAYEFESVRLEIDLAARTRGARIAKLVKPEFDREISIDLVTAQNPPCRALFVAGYATPAIFDIDFRLTEVAKPNLCAPHVPLTTEKRKGSRMKTQKGLMIASLMGAAIAFSTPSAFAQARAEAGWYLGGFHDTA